MQLVADGLLIATALAAAVYCLVLSRRLRRLTDAEAGIGGQIKALNAALEETRAGLAETRRGVAEARAALRNEKEAMARDIEAAKTERAALTALRSRALAAQAALEEMLAYDGPYVLDVETPYQEHVLPMIPGGKTVKDIIIQ